MKIRAVYAALIIGCFLLQSCVTTRVAPMREDPLIGRIIDTRTRLAIDLNTLIDNISTYDVVYLSEKHDNPDHHAFQQSVILSLVAEGMEPVLAFEFFAWHQTPDILNFIDSGNVRHSRPSEKIIENDLRTKLGWHTQSDTMWQYYFDLLSIARKNTLYAAGIDLTSALKKRITRKGIDGISGPEKEMIYSSGLNDPAYRDYMMELFKSVHCGMGHAALQKKLYDTWVARNDKMALSISRLARYKKGPVVVIIGGGHTEYGLGVIDRVAAIAPAIRQVNVAMKEIFVNPADLPAYLDPLSLEGYPRRLPADYLFFSQRVSYEDPCEKFREQLKTMKRHPGTKK